MPEDTKKSSHKGKHDPKEQRRKRQGRQQSGTVEKKVEKAPEEAKVAVPEKPAYEPPGPEFYQSLKRETDEILKITEEANSKYKKKEIQSNWAKYEMPIETYEEIDEQESLGADYEALVQASFSVGGHFQFKHEKSWDITTGPTPFDKYFDINMDSLYTALSTIPFYERNDIDTSLFSECDVQTMDHRATKFKQKYYNDKKYTTPDLEAQEKILKSLTVSDNIETSGINSNYDEDNENERDKDESELKDVNIEHKPINMFCNKIEVDPISKDTIEDLKKKDITHEFNENINEESKTHDKNEIFITNETETISAINKKTIENKDEDAIDVLQNEIIENIDEVKAEIKINQVNMVPQEITLPKAPKDYPINLPKEPPKNPIIESPEDLEKWLDDFLDG